VRLNGRVYETLVARLERRAPLALYHSALTVSVPEGEFVIEMAPIRDGHGRSRGVVAEGAVGSALLGRLRLFRYEVRRWHGGVIPDVGESVESPRRLSDDVTVARRLLQLVPEVPRAVWGRDELRAGEMWNCNSIISWLLCRSGLASVAPPEGGRAPGWQAGIVVARRSEAALGRTSPRSIRTLPHTPTNRILQALSRASGWCAESRPTKGVDR
jgi:hypothetical protein